MVRFSAALEQPSQGSEAIVQITEILDADIDAINVGFVTSLILVLFSIGSVIALAKVGSQAQTAYGGDAREPALSDGDD